MLDVYVLYNKLSIIILLSIAVLYNTNNIFFKLKFKGLRYILFKI